MIEILHRAYKRQLELALGKYRAYLTVALLLIILYPVSLLSYTLARPSVVHAQTQSITIAKPVAPEPEDVAEIKTKDVAVATATTVAVATTFGLFDMSGNLIRVFLAMLTALGLRKKGVPYGFVYDSVTKRRIPLAVIRFYDHSGRLVWTSVTDTFGMFDADLDAGKYNFHVKKNGYTHPSKIIVANADAPIDNVLSGTSFERTQTDNKELTYAIPLDPVKISVLSSIWLKIKSAFQLVLYWISLFLMVYTMISVVFLVISDPSWKKGLFAFSIILILFLIIRMQNTHKVALGQVVDPSGKPVVHLTLGLEDAEFGKIVAKQITDASGKYKFIAPPGEYKLIILDDEYEWSDGKSRTYKWDKSTPLVITDKLVVSKVA